MSWYKTAYDDNPVDQNTIMIGKVKSLAEAKKLCIQVNGRLPRIGYEMQIDTGVKTLKLGDPPGERGTIWSSPNEHKYRTYLANEAGAYRVWTYISVNPEPSGHPEYGS